MTEQRVISRVMAMSLGLKTYFTGRPCPNGHVCYRFVANYGCHECLLERSKNYHTANREKLNKRSIEYYYSNDERLTEYRKERYVRNRDKFLNRASEYRISNPAIIQEQRERRRARKLDLLGTITKGRRAQLMELQKSRCAYCNCKLIKGQEHLDHIMPLALGGLHADSNLQILCPTCNLSKHAKDPIKFARERGRLL